MDEQIPEEKPEEREETMKDLDVPEDEGKDVKGGGLDANVATKH